MGFNKEERQATPPPWGWPPAAKEKAHGVEEIVYDRSFHTTHHTKDRRHEQEKLYHKARNGADPMDTCIYKVLRARTRARTATQEASHPKTRLHPCGGSASSLRWFGLILAVVWPHPCGGSASSLRWFDLILAVVRPHPCGGSPPSLRWFTLMLAVARLQHCLSAASP